MPLIVPSQATDERDALAVMQTLSATALRDTRASQDAALAALATESTALATDEAKLAELRDELARSSLPANGQALIRTQITDLIIDMRRRQAAILKRRDELTRAEAAVAAADAEATRAAARLTNADSRLAAAKERDAER